MENPYETRRLVGEYLLFHYGGPEDVLGGLPGPAEATGFARRCVTELLGPGPRGRALDVGCAVGGSSFELSKVCDEVVGVDFSHAFVAAARELAAAGRMRCEVHEEAGRMRTFEAVVDPAARRERARFEHGDAMALPASLGGFDIVLAANLICRLREPRRFLSRLPELVRPGGQLLLTTPMTWLEEFTPRHNWLGLRKSCRAELHEILAADFELEEERDLPFLIREHARKFQYTVALGGRWRRKG